jgi:uncharacterized membrane protein
MDDPLAALTFVTALGCGLSAGALFAFSSFVMQALARLPAAEGVAAMQSINVMAPTPVFMTALFGPAVASLVLIVVGLAELGEPYAGWLIAGGVLYLGGPVGVTAVYNVPRNNALARVRPDDPDAEALWRRYVVEWTRGNHVRVAAGLAAAAAFTVALSAG